MQESELKTIKDLILEISDGASIPRLAEIAVQLTGYYARLSEEFGDIEVFRAQRWLDIRKEVKSDTMAEKTYLAGDQGKLWNDKRIKLKYIEKVVSSIKLRLRVAEGEKYNQF